MANINEGSFKEEVVGLLIGVPIVLYLKDVVITNKTIKYLSNFCGDVSYGVYIGHFLILYIMDYFKISFFLGNKFKYVIVAIGATVLLSMVMVSVIDRRLKGFRYKITNLN